MATYRPKLCAKSRFGLVSSSTVEPAAGTRRLNTVLAPESPTSRPIRPPNLLSPTPPHPVPVGKNSSLLTHLSSLISSPIINRQSRFYCCCSCRRRRRSPRRSPRRQFLIPGWSTPARPSCQPQHRDPPCRSIGALPALFRPIAARLVHCPCRPSSCYAYLFLLHCTIMSLSFHHSLQRQLHFFFLPMASPKGQHSAEGPAPPEVGRQQLAVTSPISASGSHMSSFYTPNNRNPHLDQFRKTSRLIICARVSMQFTNQVTLSHGTCTTRNCIHRIGTFLLSRCPRRGTSARKPNPRPAFVQHARHRYYVVHKRQIQAPLTSSSPLAHRDKSVSHHHHHHSYTSWHKHLYYLMSST